MPSAEQLHTELWHSLAALLRSYTASHGLNRGQSATIEADEERISVRHGARWLELRRSGASVAWMRENGESGQLEMTEHGRLRSPAGEEELDMAVEAWARELMV
ncbi:MAG TPA: transcriptional regulator [Terracidiphilus sp.]